MENYLYFLLPYLLLMKFNYNAFTYQRTCMYMAKNELIGFDISYAYFPATPVLICKIGKLILLYFIWVKISWIVVAVLLAVEFIILPILPINHNKNIDLFKRILENEKQYDVLSFFNDQLRNLNK